MQTVPLSFWPASFDQKKEGALLAMCRNSRVSFSLFAALGSVALLAGNNINTMMSADVIAPGPMAFYRWFLALLILTPFVASDVWKHRRQAIKHWKELAFLGFLGMVLYQSLAYNAARSTTAINMAAIYATTPLLTSIMAWLLADEKLSVQRLLGGLVSLIGVLIITGRGDPTLFFSDGPTPGDGLMMIAAFAYGTFNALLMRWPMELPLWVRLFWQLTYANLLLFPMWLMGPISPVTLNNLPLILYAGVAASLLAPYWWLVGIRELGASRAAVLTNLGPPIVGLLAYFLLGEALQFYHLIGAAFIFGGVALSLIHGTRQD